MSTIVCGKRSLFEDLPTTPVSSSKRIRCSSSTSPIRLSPPRPISATLSSSPSSADSTPLLNHLRAIFPDMDDQVAYLFIFALNNFFVTRVAKKRSCSLIGRTRGPRVVMLVFRTPPTLPLT
uniref:Uncharacterized protein n=1 Tax=Nelumbo nucifera TaxID=4432 RepID=A0A822Z015_NELNU|nr:TPA_asm: hypothetical protein HUJ06_008963 [Nelumbo nucifera]